MSKGCWDFSFPDSSSPKKKRYSFLIHTFLSVLFSAFPELLQSGQRQQRWRWRRRSRGWRLWDPPHHTPQPCRPLSAAPHGARVRVPLPLPASQRPAQHLLLPWAACPHDVQHAGSGHPPPLGAYALSEYSTFLFLFFCLSLFSSGPLWSCKSSAVLSY